MVKYANATPTAIISILLKPENISTVRMIAVSGVREDAARNDDIAMSAIAPEYCSGNIFIATAAFEMRAPRIAPKVSNGISVPPVIPVFVDTRRSNALMISNAMSIYQTGAFSENISSIIWCPEPSAPLRKKPIVATVIKMIRTLTYAGILESFLFISVLKLLYIFVKAVEIPPTVSPIIIAIQMYLSGRATAASSSKSFGDILRKEKALQRIDTVRVAARVAVEATINMMGEKRRCASSIAKIMPVSGAPVAAVKPAHAPPVSVYFSNARLPFAKMFTVPFPIEHPICTLGPSFPRGTPTRKVRRVEKNIPNKLRIHLKGINPRIIAIEFGIPLPRIIGNNFIKTKDIIPIKAAPSINRGKSAGLLRIDA